MCRTSAGENAGRCHSGGVGALPHWNRTAASWPSMRRPAVRPGGKAVSGASSGAWAPWRSTRHRSAATVLRGCVERPETARRSSSACGCRTPRAGAGSSPPTSSGRRPTSGLQAVRRPGVAAVRVPGLLVEVPVLLRHRRTAQPLLGLAQVEEHLTLADLRSPDHPGGGGRDEETGRGGVGEGRCSPPSGTPMRARCQRASPPRWRSPLRSPHRCCRRRPPGCPASTPVRCQARRIRPADNAFRKWASGKKPWQGPSGVAVIASSLKAEENCGAYQAAHAASG